MKLSRTKEYNFGWLMVVPAIDVVFLLIFFPLLSSNFILQPGIAVSLPFSVSLLAAPENQQIISITGGSGAGDLFSRSKNDARKSWAVAWMRPSARIARSSLKPTELTPYELVVAVTNAALEHGITSVALAALRRNNVDLRPRQLSRSFLTGTPAPPKSGLRRVLIALVRRSRRSVFIFFRLFIRPTVALLPPPARLEFDHAGFGRRPDPAALDGSGRSRAGLEHAAAAHAASVALCRKIEHVPSYFANEPVLKQPPPLIVDLSAPSAQPPGPVPMIHRATRATLGNLRPPLRSPRRSIHLVQARLPPPKFAASTNEPPQNRSVSRLPWAPSRRNRVLLAAQFIGRSGLGRASPELSRALPFSQLSRLRNEWSELLVWGVATIEWGNDVAAHRQHRQPLLRRDPGQSCRAGYNLSAAFSCHDFSSLDSW